ncbi:MAG: tail fiber domain-containing protein, partial [Bacteroidetes bacterium]|nr:tail fiber domain-containing protein [Bacteroidota bacterium]
QSFWFYSGVEWTEITTGNLHGTIQSHNPADTLSIRAADEGSVPGNTRGVYSVDLQTVRDSSSQIASGYYSVISGGIANKASDSYATIGGGANNVGSGLYATIGGGSNNISSGEFATIGGGLANTNSGGSATIGGGYENANSAPWATIGGGFENANSGPFATIGGGFQNTIITGLGATIGGGDNNSVSGLKATIGGGGDNIASGDFATIPGGYYLNAPSYGETVIGTYNESYTPVNSYSFSADDRLFVVGNGTNVANRSNALTLLKSGNLGLGTSTPDTTLHLVGQFKYQDGNEHNGYVLTSDANGVASWQAEIPHGVIQGTDGHTHNLRAAKEGSPGNARGEYSVDLQTFRSNGNQVASESWSTIGGGAHNRASNVYAVVSGGRNNIASKEQATIGGGAYNTASGSASTVSGGIYNTASGNFSCIPGGINLLSPSYAETVVGTHNETYTPASINTFSPTDRLFVVGNGDSYLNRSNALTILKSGRVGIGTSTPTKALLEINGSVNYDPATIGYLNQAGNIGSYNPNSWPYSIYASHVISGLEFHAHSDRRIKQILGVSDSQTDLATLMEIEITDYRFRDTIAKGNRHMKKVIAQQLAEVYPQAVNSTTTEVVPDIYQQAEIRDGWIMLDNDLTEGERVKIISDQASEIYEVLTSEKHRFQVKELKAGEGRIFVYGREVHDFHTVDYEAISMLNVSATQEQQRRIETLEGENQQLNIMVQKLQARLDLLEARSSTVR